MAIRKFIAEELIAYVRARAAISNKATPGTQDQDILNRLNEEMMATVVPVIRRMREEYFVVTRRLSVTGGQTRYRIPNRAIGQQIRSLFLYNGSARIPLTMISREMLGTSFGQDGAEFPRGFYIEGNHIVLTDSSFVAGSLLEVAYLIRPGQLVLASETRIIQSVDQATNTITLMTSIPESWSAAAQGFDVHSPYSGAELKQFDLTLVAATGVTVQVAELLDGTVFGTYVPAAGDYICLAGEAALPAIPIEYHIPLAQAAVCRIIEALGDVELLAEHKKTLGEMLQNEKSLIANRVGSHARKIVPSNPFFSGGGRWQAGGIW